MERTFIAPGVHLSCDPAEKFNRCRISIHFAFPAQRATATAHALLPLVLERGYADCPDMTLLTKKLAKLYGADLTVDARPMGCNHNLCVSVTGIKDRFALEGEPLTREYASIALGAAFHPAFVGGVFDPQAVEIEKQMLKKALEFTVEAGRPDSITMEKLEILKRAGVTRISINPQTMKQHTLELLGRNHTVERVNETFWMARKAGFDNINMDVIVGLPEEDEVDFCNTLYKIHELDPDSVTVHTLVIKRASRMRREQMERGGEIRTEDTLIPIIQQAREDI